jgi:FlaA1/EpsC-like NDP-sugar epimerase
MTDHARNSRNVLIVGAGDAGRGIAREYARVRGNDHPIGFIDDDPMKKGLEFDGLPVFGGREVLSEMIVRYAVTRVIVALPSAHVDTTREIVHIVLSVDSNIAIEIMPTFVRFLEGALSTTLQNIRLADIIDRDEYAPDVAAMESHYRGSTVLITGAGGSIGSELCRQIARFNPTRIVCVGRGENSIYELERSLAGLELLTSVSLVFKICDVKDYALLKRVFSEYSPAVVFHAAAHKHVPMMESNEAEALQNNVGGSNNVFHLCVECGVRQAVLISTDKAVNPASVMGASKRLCELVALYYHQKYQLNISIVRFGNVLGSRGSVIPLFIDQIERGGPVTVTHPDMRRFFMSISEAALLVINAGAYARGGEVFVLNMGAQYRIDDIARKLIERYGYKAGRDIEIVYTGLRPGEKLSEELSYSREELLPTLNEKISVLGDTDAIDEKVIERLVAVTLREVHALDGGSIRKEILSVVPECRFTI